MAFLHEHIQCEGKYTQPRPEHPARDALQIVKGVLQSDGDEIMKAVKHDEVLEGRSRKVHLYLVGYWASGEPHCKRCDMTFEDHEDLALHKSHWHWEEMLCKACDMGFTTKKMQKAHLRDWPSWDHNIIRCIGCVKSFATHSHMMQHVENEDCWSGLTSAMLDAILSTYCSAFDPSSKHNINKKCPTCHEEFGQISSMFSHFEDRACSLRDWQNETRLVNFLNFAKKVRFKIEDVVPSCRGCARNFSSHSALNAHLHEKHQDTFCWSCRTHADSWEARQVHILEETWIPGRICVCDYCQEVFETELAYNDHARDSHTACGPCGLVFKTREELSEHEYVDHKTCPFCFEFYRYLSDLHAHRKVCGVKTALVADTVKEEEEDDEEVPLLVAVDRITAGLTSITLEADLPGPGPLVEACS